MRSFQELYDWAAERKGGAAQLETMFDQPKSPAELAAIPDDRWLAEISRRVFQAGFNWTVIDNKWPGFETAFEGFNPNRWAMMSDDDLDRLLQDTAIVRHAKKILSVRDNAIFITDLAQEHGSAGQFFANSPSTDYIGLLATLKQRGAYLGGTTAQYFLRSIGVDAVVFTRDVAVALVREGVVDKSPTSKRDLAACQEAFNTWMEEGSRPLNHISRVLAFTVGD